MKMVELKKKEKSELYLMLDGYLREQFRLKLMKGNGDFTKTHLLKKIRKNIARVNTALSKLFLSQ